MDLGDLEFLREEFGDLLDGARYFEDNLRRQQQTRSLSPPRWMPESAVEAPGEILDDLEVDEEFWEPVPLSPVTRAPPLVPPGAFGLLPPGEPCLVCGESAANLERTTFQCRHPGGQCPWLSQACRGCIDRTREAPEAFGELCPGCRGRLMADVYRWGY